MNVNYIEKRTVKDLDNLTKMKGGRGRADLRSPDPLKIQ